MTEPRWLVSARAEIGQREIPGRKHNPRVLQYWLLIRAPFTDDETPWCAGFVGAMLEKNGIKSTRSAMARSYQKYGRKLSSPIVGCIVVLSRAGAPGSGHVGFYVGRDSRGNLMILGGNQGDAVNIKPFSESRVVEGGYRWPSDEPMTTVDSERFDTDEEVSQRESFGYFPPEEKPSLFRRLRNWAAGGGIFGFLTYMTDWQIALVIMVGVIITGAALVAFLVWLFGAEDLRRWIKKQVN